MAADEGSATPEVRRYRKRRRADQERVTHRRILDAALALVAELGVDGLTVSAVARRAGVQRLTVYRHFPDDSLLHACSMLQAERHPLPDPAEWAAIRDPERRLRGALRRIYGHYRENADYLAAVSRAGTGTDVTDNYLENVMATLVAGWKPRPKRAAQLDATLEHVLRFETWRSLTSGAGLDDKAAARLATRWVRAIAR
ncbi:MAG: helix-turn-helix domain-containing protein [Gemmatimonadota bacterium]|jgi:AcrR family transcriptional regulator